MELSIDVTPEGEAVDSELSSPMGGKHQRSLSLSEKWATNKALALEYLKRQREIMVWAEDVLKRKLPTNDLHECFKSGIVLRELMEELFPEAAASAISPISRKYSLRMAPWKERENISVFLKQCKALGMNDLSLFCTDDLYEGTNMVQVLFCIQHFMKFSAEHSGRDFQAGVKHSVAMNFSNQELEMALSKLEQAGMNASALKDLINACDEEVRDTEIVEGVSIEVAVTEANPPSVDGDAAESDQDEIFGQLEQLEQDLMTNESNQPLAGASMEDGDSPNGISFDSPEVNDDDADDALNGLQDTVSLVCEEIKDGQVVDGEGETEEEVEAVLSPDDLCELSNLLTAMIADIESAMVEEMKTLLKHHDAGETKADNPVVDTDVVVAVPSQMCESGLNTELTCTDGAKSETVGADSSAHAVAEDVTEVEEQAKVPKRKKKRSKTKRARSSSDEQLDAEVMAKCACGRGCTMM